MNKLQKKWFFEDDFRLRFIPNGKLHRFIIYIYIELRYGCNEIICRYSLNILSLKSWLKYEKLRNNIRHFRWRIKWKQIEFIFSFNILYIFNFEWITFYLAHWTINADYRSERSVHASTCYFFFWTSRNSMDTEMMAFFHIPIFDGMLD